jgi:hypothetical protein
VVRDALTLGRWDLISADVETPVYGGRIAAHNFAAVPNGKLDGKGTLARGRRTQDRQNRFAQGYILKSASIATAPSRMIRPSCCGRVGNVTSCYLKSAGSSL